MKFLLLRGFLEDETCAIQLPITETFIHKTRFRLAMFTTAVFTPIKPPQRMSWPFYNFEVFRDAYGWDPLPDDVDKDLWEQWEQAGQEEENVLASFPLSSVGNTFVGSPYITYDINGNICLKFCIRYTRTHIESEPFTLSDLLGEES